MDMDMDGYEYEVHGYGLDMDTEKYIHCDLYFETKQFEFIINPDPYCTP